MLKKLLITIIFAITLLGVGVFAQPTPLAQATSSTAPSTDVKSSQFMFDVGVITHKDIKERNWIRKGVNFVFERVITILAATVGGAAVLMMAVGGFMMIASAGRQDMYDKGKSYILKAVIGLAFVLGAYILVTTVQLLIKSIFTG